jgi:hypothetical protein
MALRLLNRTAAVARVARTVSVPKRVSCYLAHHRVHRARAREPPISLRVVALQACASSQPH